MVRHNTLYAIQHKQLKVPTTKIYKKLLLPDERIKHIDFQTTLMEEEQHCSPIREDEDSIQQSTGSKKAGNLSSEERKTDKGNKESIG